MLFEKIKLEPEEEILATVRKHWFIITVELLGIMFVAALPFIILVGILTTPVREIVSFAEYGSLITFGMCIWLLLSSLAGFMVWTHYYLDLWVVTDRRIILVDQIHFFNRNVSIFRLERMQDIEYKIKGIIPTLLNFGTLQAQTAGAHESNFKSTGLPDPRGLQATIQAAMDERMRVLHINPDMINQH